MMDLRALLFLLFFIQFTYSAHLPSTSRCSKHCSKETCHKFDYKDHTSYFYDFQSSNVIYWDKLGRLKPIAMSAKVEIIKRDTCDMILKIHETKLLANDISREKLRELTWHDLPFSFEDGKISEICPAPEEKRNVLNIKRAILSAFQNSMKNFDEEDESVLENDIIGRCWASYAIMEKEKKKVIVRKFKNPGNCETISNGNSVSLTTFESFRGAETAIIEQMYECEQTIEEKIITKSSCNESCVFTISTEKDSQFKSNAKIELRLTGILQKPEMPSYRIHRREHLLYAHQPHTFSNSAYKESLQILHDMCSKILPRNKVDPEIPGLYANLVRSLRKVKSEELKNIYNKLDNGEICSSDWLKRLADDILPHIGHEGSVKIMTRKIQSRTISKIQAALWVTSLAFIKHPTEEAISAVVPLLDYKKAGTQALLGITAMCNNYCMKNTNCEHSKAIQDVINSLNRYLRYRCNVHQPTEIKQVIAALKSFGNLGRNGAAWRQILECSSQKSNVVTIRLAAIEAFRRTPCKEEVNQKLLDMFSRQDEPVEVRIAAYLGAMRCADRKLVRRIQQVYDSERLNQIKTFVYSHITNLQESSSPEKENIRRIVSEFQFQPQQLDIRKYSQNIELSNYIQRMHLGGEFDSNIIYSKNSVIPRSFMANFTSFVNGKSINVMEVGGRLDGFDQWLKNSLSSISEFDHMSFSEFVKYAFAAAKKNFQSLRSQPETFKHKFQSNIDSFIAFTKKNMPSDAYGSLYFKYLGNELMWLSVDEKTDFNIEKFIDVMDIISKLARNQKLDTAHSLFLDTSYVFPSISGNALTVDVAGSAILGLKGEGKLDIRKIFLSPRNVDIEGKFVTSFASELNAVVGYNSLLKISKIKYNAKAHGGSVLKGKLAIKDGRIFNMNIDLPEENVDLLTVSTNVIRIDKDGNEIKNSSSMGIRDCLKTFRKVMGYDICTYMTFPATKLKPKFPFISLKIPFTKPFEAGISLRKQDRSLKGILLNIELPDNNVYSNKKFKFEFDTPGSSIDRKYSLEIVTPGTIDTYDTNQNRSYSFRVYTPFIAMEMKRNILNIPKKNIFDLKMNIGGKQNWRFLAEFETNNTENIVEHHVNFEISNPNREPFFIKGTVIRKKGKKSVITVNLLSNKQSPYPVLITGSIIKEQDGETIKLSTDFYTELPFTKVQIYGLAQANKKIIFYDLDINYHTKKDQKHSLKSTCKIENLSTKFVTMFKSKADLQSTQFPKYNSQIEWDFQYKPKKDIENYLTIKSDNETIFLLHQMFIIKKEDPQNFITLNNLRVLIIIPKYRADYEMSFSVRYNAEVPAFYIYAEIQNSKEVRFRSSLEFSLISEKPMKMMLNFILEYPYRTIKYIDELTEVSPNEFKGKSKLQWDKDKELTFEYSYKLKREINYFQHEIDTDFSAPWLRSPVEYRGLLKMSGNSFDFKSSTGYKGKPAYKVDVKIDPRESSMLYVDIPHYGKSGVEFDVSGEDTILKFDLRRPESKRRILGDFTMRTQPNPVTQLELSWDADRDPTARLAFKSEVQIQSGKHCIIMNTIEYKNDISIYSKVKVSNRILLGPHDLILEVKEEKTYSIHLHYEIDESILKLEFSTEFQGEEIFRAYIKGKMLTQTARREVSCVAGIYSFNPEWDRKEIRLTHIQDFSQFISLKTELEVYLASDKQYLISAELNSFSFSIVEAALTLKTPIKEFKTREIRLTSEFSINKLKFNGDYITDEGKTLSIFGHSETTELGGVSQYNILIPRSKIMQHAKFQIEYNLESPNYTLQGYLFINDKKKLNMSGGFSGRNIHNFECNIVIESYLTSAFVGHIKGKINNLLKKIDVVFKNNSKEKFSARFFTDSGRPDHNGELEVKGEGKRIIYMDVKCEETFAKKRCYLNFGGAITSFVLLNFSRENSIIKPAINICWKGRYKNFDCVEIGISLKNEHSPYTSDVVRGIKINIKTPGKEDWSFEFLKSMKKDDYQHKFILASPEKKLGYDIHVDDIGLPTKSGQIQIYFPSRVIKAQGRLRTEILDFHISSELLLDAKRQPDRKYSFDYYYKYEYVGITYHVDSKLKLNSPALSKPISAEFDVLAKTEEDMFSTYTTFTLDYSDNRGKNIYADIRTNIAPDLQGNNTISFVLNSEDYRFLNILINPHFAYTRELISSGFLWEFASNYSRKKSGLSFIKIEPLNNNFEVLHKSDKDTFHAFGKWKFLSNDILITDLDVRINNKERKKIEATTEYRKPCITIIYHTVGNKTKETKYHFCINFDKSNLLSLTANAFYDNKKITDFLITFNSYINKFLITTSDETSLQSLETAVITIISDSILNFVNYTNLMGIIVKEYILTKLSDFNPTFNSDVWPDILEFEEELENNVRLASRKVRAIYQTLPSKRDIRDSFKPLRDYMEKMKDGLGKLYDKVRPKFLDKYIDKSKKAIGEKTDSVSNYFRSLKEVFRNHGIKAVVNKLYYDIFTSLAPKSKEKS